MLPLNSLYLIDNARRLRKRSTRAERIVWLFLRSSRMLHYKFYRQKPIGDFIADFFCYKLKLVIEIDGITHETPKVRQKDKEKDSYFSSLGLKVMRFTDEEVLGAGNLVEKRIKEFIILRESENRM